MSMIKTYSDFCNTKWAEVWEINIIEFFQTIAFCREYERRKSKEIEKLYKKHK